MEILYDKIVKFSNTVNQKEWIDLIENTSNDSYPFLEVERRPHLTMMLPMILTEKDSFNSIKLRNLFYATVFDHLANYMKHYNNFGIVSKKNIIGVSKLTANKSMPYHNDSNDLKHIIGMLYLSEDFEGGELSFRDIPLVYKPKIGDFIIYPGSLSHCVKEMTGNPRYSMGVGFLDPFYIDKPFIQVYN